MSGETINDVIVRCKGQSPDVVLRGHYGYYLHDDVAALINEIIRLRTAVCVERDKRISAAADQSQKASDDAWAVWGSE